MKRCPFCAEEIQDAAVKCRHCGSMLAVATAPAPVLPTAVDRPVEMIFTGSPTWRAQLAAHIAAFALVVGGLVLGLALATGWDQPASTAVVAGVVLSGAGALWLFSLWLARIVQYRVSTLTIDVESGLLSKRIDTVQLWKVRDLQYYQTLLDRILGQARITIFTQDVSTPHFILWGLPATRTIFERLKNAIEIARQAHNIIGVTE